MSLRQNPSHYPLNQFVFHKTQVRQTSITFLTTHERGTNTATATTTITRDSRGRKRSRQQQNQIMSRAWSRTADVYARIRFAWTYLMWYEVSVVFWGGPTYPLTRWLYTVLSLPGTSPRGMSVFQNRFSRNADAALQRARVPLYLYLQISTRPFRSTQLSMSPVPKFSKNRFRKTDYPRWYTLQM